MLNQVILVGRLTKDLDKIETNRPSIMLQLAIPRSFKNSEGEYETDFIDCELWNSVAQNTSEYCKKGDIIGVKGRLESYSVENENGTFTYKQKVVAEKVTFLSSKSND